MSAGGIQASDTLMTEIGILSENALPQEYMDIAAESEPILHEEFIDFVAPILDDDSLTNIRVQKGVWSC